MANEAAMAQAIRGSDFQAPEGGYLPNPKQYSAGAYGQPREPGQGVVPPEMLREAMTPAPAPEPAPEPRTQESFDPNAYWNAYPDVAQHTQFGRNVPGGAWAHYQQYGKNEGGGIGRNAGFTNGAAPAQQPNAANPEELQSIIEQLRGGGGYGVNMGAF